MSESESRIVLVGYPGLPTGDARAACHSCERLYPVHRATRRLIQRMAEAGPPYAVICHSCYTTAFGPVTNVMGVREATARWNLG